MGYKKKDIAKLFKVSLLTVDNWAKKGKIKKCEGTNQLMYECINILEIAKKEQLILKEKQRVIEESIFNIENKIKQEELYKKNLDKYNNQINKL